MAVLDFLGLNAERKLKDQEISGRKQDSFSNTPKGLSQIRKRVSYNILYESPFNVNF